MLVLPSGDLEGLKLVQSGGFGNVFRGWSQTLKMEVALKVIQGACSSNLEKLMKDLMKERNVMQKASNPHVLRLLGVYEKVEGSLVEHGLVMEFMPFGSLRSLFDNIPDVPWALRFQILHQVALGMNYLHSLDPPIIHRDLKPCNVLLNKHLDVQITDFGLSKIVGVTTSAVPLLAGTLPYIAPEALRDINYQPSKACDVYSFGILVWTVFSGEEPYPGILGTVIQRCVLEGQRPRETILDQYSDVKMIPEAKDLMIRCWDHKPDRRPSFHGCIECTMVMSEAYQRETVCAVRSVQDILTGIDSSKQQCNSICYTSGGTEEFLKALAMGETNQDSQQSCQGAAGEDPTSSMGLDSAREQFQDAEDDSDSGNEIDNIVTLIKGSGDYKKITGKLNKEGVISEEEKKKLNSSRNLKDFGSATEKFIVKKLRKNPGLMLPTFKSIFNL